MDINKIMLDLEAKHPGEKEYLQAVKEVLMSVEEVYNQHPEFERNKIVERMVEPDRIKAVSVSTHLSICPSSSSSALSRPSRTL